LIYKAILVSLRHFLATMVQGWAHRLSLQGDNVGGRPMWQNQQVKSGRRTHARGSPHRKRRCHHRAGKAAPDQFRANSGLKVQEYSGPILGLIFLRFAEVRFAVQHKKLAKAGASSRRGNQAEDPAAYHAEGIL
jgi:hypothetical protein